MSEVNICSTKASVLLYDNEERKWNLVGKADGPSKVQLYHNITNNKYRIVAWKISDREVVLNYGIPTTLHYFKANAVFHQWRESAHVYGLSFTSPSDADEFASAVHNALEVIKQDNNDAGPKLIHKDVKSNFPSNVNHVNPINRISPLNQNDDHHQVSVEHNEMFQNSGNNVTTNGTIASPSVGKPQVNSRHSLDFTTESSSLEHSGSPPLGLSLRQDINMQSSPVQLRKDLSQNMGYFTTPPSGSDNNITGQTTAGVNNEPLHTSVTPPPPSAPPPPPPAPPPPPMGSKSGLLTSLKSAGGLTAALKDTKLKQIKLEVTDPISSQTGGVSSKGKMSMMDEMAAKLKQRSVQSNISGKSKEVSSCPTTPLKLNFSVLSSPKFRNISVTGSPTEKQTCIPKNNLPDSLTMIKEEIITEIRNEFKQLKIHIIAEIKSELSINGIITTQN